MSSPPIPKLNIQQFLDLEKQIWDAFISGNAEADSNFLADDFLGVYATGFSSKAEHCEQLRNGPVASQYDLQMPRLLILSDNIVLLSYLAVWVRAGTREPLITEKMYVSSLWKRTDGIWKNLFSQDTSASPPS